MLAQDYEALSGPTGGGWSPQRLRHLGEGCPSAGEHMRGSPLRAQLQRAQAAHCQGQYVPNLRHLAWFSSARYALFDRCCAD